MKKQFFLTLLLLIVTVPCLRAQKKELAQARTYIKSGKDFDKAERLMTDLLKDEANRDNKKIYVTWYDAVKAQYAVENEKIYLHQKYDTAAFFGLIQKMYAITESLDSIDAKPDGNGRLRPEFRKSHADDMHRLRRNVYYGGTYFLRKCNYTRAFSFFDTYLDAASQPLFTGYDYARTDTLMKEAAYWAVFCGFKQKDPAMTLKYSKLALTNSQKAKYTLQYACEAYHQTGNDAAYINTLKEGCRQYPDYPYFFPRLASYYNSISRPDSVVLLADDALARYPEKPIFLLAKSAALLKMDKYSECVAISQKLIDNHPDMPEPYLNVGTVYLNQALELEKKNEPRTYHDQIVGLYTKAKPYMETYRKLNPEGGRLWAPALYRIYLNLNMDTQFREIDTLLKTM